MAGKRLEYWTTLPYDELVRRVQIEMRMTNLSFAQQQFLDAALERLRTWPGPKSMLLRLPSGRRNMDDEPLKETTPEKQEPTPAPAKAKKEKKAVAKKAVKAKGGRKKKASANGTSKRAGRAPRIADEAKITKTGKENPFREGSGSYERVEAVLKLSGQTAGTIKRKIGDLKPSTLSNMVRLGLIRAAE